MTQAKRKSTSKHARPRRSTDPPAAAPRSVGPLAREIEQQLAKRGDPARAKILSGGYAPTKLRCLGASVPTLRAIVRQVSREIRAWPPREVVRLAVALARGGTLEGRQAGVELLARRADAMVLLTCRQVEQLGDGNDNWVSVDTFATLVAGPAWRQGQIVDGDVRRWARSTDRWWRRAALASTVPLNLQARGGHGDRQRTLMVARLFVDERDPMLAKALSWAIRSLIPIDPAAVKAFLVRYDGRLPAIVRREVATKLLTGRKSR